LLPAYKDFSEVATSTFMEKITKLNKFDMKAKIAIAKELQKNPLMLELANSLQNDNDLVEFVELSLKEAGMCVLRVVVVVVDVLNQLLF
jgi:hypothetical protein